MRKKVNIYKLLKTTGNQFLGDHGIKLSASLSYYTIFALLPLIIVVMSIIGFFFGHDATQGKIYGQIHETVGSAAAIEIQDIIKKIEAAHHTFAGTIVGIIILILGATGVFEEIQDSINFIWCIKAKPKNGWLKIIMNRLLSFGLVVSLGFVLLVSLLVNSIMDLFNDRLQFLFADATLQILYFVNMIMMFLIITVMFAVIFKVLPDAKIKWKDSFIGACFTAFLFMIGKFVIGYYIASSNLDATYGAAATLMIVLLWVYYSSVILFFGAEFTQVYATHYGGGVKPYDTAVFIVKQEVREIAAVEL